MQEAKKPSSTHVKEGADEYLSLDEIRLRIAECANLMKEAAKNLQFEEAAKQRDKMRRYQDLEVTLS